MISISDILNKFKFFINDKWRFDSRKNRFWMGE